MNKLVKKSVSLLAVVALLMIALIPAGALATGNNPVAITDKTLQLVGGTSYILNGPVSLNNTITAVKGTNGADIINIDLNNYNLTGNGDDGALVVYPDVTVNISGGTRNVNTGGIITATKGPAVLTSWGPLTLENVTVQATDTVNAGIQAGASLNVTQGTNKIQAPYYGIIMVEDAKVTIRGNATITGTKADSHAIFQVGGTEQEGQNASLTIEDGAKITSGSSNSADNPDNPFACPIVLSNKGIFNIGTESSEKLVDIQAVGNGAGILVRGGTLTLGNYVKVTATGIKKGWAGDAKHDGEKRNQLPCSAVILDEYADYPSGRPRVDISNTEATHYTSDSSFPHFAYLAGTANATKYGQYNPETVGTLKPWITFTQNQRLSIADDNKPYPSTLTATTNCWNWLDTTWVAEKTLRSDDRSSEIAIESSTGSNPPVTTIDTTVSYTLKAPQTASTPATDAPLNTITLGPSNKAVDVTSSVPVTFGKGIITVTPSTATILRGQSVDLHGWINGVSAADGAGSWMLGSSSSSSLSTSGEYTAKPEQANEATIYTYTAAEASGRATVTAYPLVIDNPNTSMPAHHITNGLTVLVDKDGKPAPIASAGLTIDNTVTPTFGANSTYNWTVTKKDANTAAVTVDSAISLSSTELNKLDVGEYTVKANPTVQGITPPPDVPIEITAVPTVTVQAKESSVTWPQSSVTGPTLEVEAAANAPANWQNNVTFAWYSGTKPEGTPLSNRGPSFTVPIKELSGEQNQYSFCCVVQSTKPSELAVTNSPVQFTVTVQRALTITSSSRNVQPGKTTTFTAEYGPANTQSGSWKWELDPVVAGFSLKPETGSNTTTLAAPTTTDATRVTVKATWTSIDDPTQTATGSITMDVMAPELNNPDSWEPGNQGVDVKDDIVICDQDTVEDGDATIQVSTGAIQLVSTTASGIEIEDFVTFPPDNPGVIAVSRQALPGVYKVKVRTVGTMSRAETTQREITIVVQGTATISPSGTVQLYQGDRKSLQASLKSINEAQKDDVQWDWNLDPAPFGVTLNKAGAFATLTSTSAASGKGRITVTASVENQPLATIDVSVEVREQPASLTINLAPARNPLQSLDNPITADGMQYVFSALGGPADATYAWTIAAATNPATPNPAGAVPPAISGSTQSIAFIPTVNNVGTWTVSLTATASDGTSKTETFTLTIQRNTVDPSISTYSPPSSSILASPGTALNFSLTALPGTDANGNTINASVYWTTTAGVTGTPAAGTASPSFSLQVPDNAPDSFAVTAHVRSSAGSKDLDSHTWTITRANPTPSVSLDQPISVIGGTLGTDNSIQMIPGGQATFTAILGSLNNPDDFNIVWQVLPNGATDAWTTAHGVTGSTGLKFVTQPMTLAMNGQQYRVLVTNKRHPEIPPATAGPILLTINPVTLQPVVTIDRTSPRFAPAESEDSYRTITVAAGQDVIMDASAKLPEGITPTYQWQRGQALTEGQIEANRQWTDIPNATSSRLTLTNVSAEDNNCVFRCRASVNYNDGMSAVSEPIQLNVTTESGWVTITSLTVNGEETDLAVYTPSVPLELAVTATVTGSGSPAYQWYVATGDEDSGSPVEGATKATFTPIDLEEGNSYTYWCEVSNASNSSVPAVTSNTVKVVYPSTSGESGQPQIIRNLPTSIDAATGSTATLSIEAFVEADVPLDYTWQCISPDGATNTLAGSTGPTLTLTNVTASYGGNKYQCIVRNRATGQTTKSGECMLNVFYNTAYLTINAQPPTQTILATPLAPNQSQISATVQLAGTQDLSTYTYRWMYAKTADDDYTAFAVPDDSSSARVATYTASGSLSDYPATPVSGSTFAVRVPLELEYPDSSNQKVPIPAGYYKLYITNTLSAPLTASGTDTSNPDAHAITKTNPAYVFVAEPGTVGILTQPQMQTVAQGATATYSVAARTPDGNALTYQWQKWVYGTAPANAITTPVPEGVTAGSGYWWDCTDADGTGYTTNTFTTIPTTAQMRLAATQGQPIFYRCLVYSQVSGNSLASDAARLKVTAEIPIQPGLVPINGSGLSVVNNYLRGLNATKDGTTVGTLISQMTEYRNCTIVVRDSRGTALTNMSVVVGTACTIEIQNAAGEVLDGPAIIIVRGDVLGTGKMSLSQLVQMAGYYKGTTMLSGPYLMAGDLTGTGNINLSDLVSEAKAYRQMIGSAQPTASPTPAPSVSASPTPSPSATATMSPSPSPSASRTVWPSAS